MSGSRGPAGEQDTGDAALPRVALVKSPGRADAFVLALREVGVLPVLVSPFRVDRIEDGERAFREAATAHDDRPTWIAVTSPHAATAVRPLRDIAGLAPIAAVGAGTASALHAAGFLPVLVGDAGGHALAQRMLASGLAAGSLVLHPCGEDARHELSETLGAAGVRVQAVPVYRMSPDPVGERAAEGTFAAVVVTSPRLAHRAMELFPGRPPVVAIGRTTASALRDLGWTPAAVAATPAPDDVAAAVRSTR